MGIEVLIGMLRLTSAASRFGASRLHVAWKQTQVANRRGLGSKPSQEFASLMEEEIGLDERSRTRAPERTRNMNFLMQAFTEFDLNQDRLLQKDELRLALQSLNLSAAASDEVFELLAKNNDEGIQLDEWMDGMPHKLLEVLGGRYKLLHCQDRMRSTRGPALNL